VVIEAQHPSNILTCGLVVPTFPHLGCNKFSRGRHPRSGGRGGGECEPASRKKLIRVTAGLRGSVARPVCVLPHLGTSNRLQTSLVKFSRAPKHVAPPHQRKAASEPDEVPCFRGAEILNQVSIPGSWGDKL